MSTELLIKRYNYTLIEAKNILFILPLMTILFVPLYSSLVTKYGKKSLLMIVSFSLCVAAYLLAYFLPSRPSKLMYAFVFLMGQYRSLYSSCVWSSILQVTPSKLEPLAIGIGLFFTNLMLGVLPIYFGHVVESDNEIGFQKAIGNLLAIAVVCLLNSIAVFLVDQRNGSLLYIGENSKEAKLLKDRINQGIYGPLEAKSSDEDIVDGYKNVREEDLTEQHLREKVRILTRDSGVFLNDPH